MFDATTINAIADLAKAGQRPQIIETKGLEPPGSYYLAHPDGRMELARGRPKDHNEHLRTPDAFVAFARQYLNKDDSAVFYGETGIVGRYEFEDGRNYCACAMLPAPQFTLLAQWASPAAGMMTQVALIRALRINLRGCLQSSSDLLPLIRKLRFNAASEAAADLQHGRESMGKTIDRQIAGAEVMPEEVTLFVPVWENFSYRAQIACALEIFPAEQAFKLTPYPLEMQWAMDRALDALGEVLTADDLPPAFLGSP